MISSEFKILSCNSGVNVFCSSKVKGETSSFNTAGSLVGLLSSFSHYSDGSATDRLVDCLTKGGEAGPPLLFNVFEEVAPGGFSNLELYWQQFLGAGAREVHLAGSGPVLFSLFRDRARAEEICHRLSKLGLKPYLTDTLASLGKLE